MAWEQILIGQIYSVGGGFHETHTVLSRCTNGTSIGSGQVLMGHIYRAGAGDYWLQLYIYMAWKEQVGLGPL